MSLFKEDAVAGHDGLVKSESRLRAVPIDELSDGMVVRSLRTWRGQAVEDRGFGLLEIGQPEDCPWMWLSFALRHPDILGESGAGYPVHAGAFGGRDRIGWPSARHASECAATCLGAAQSKLNRGTQSLIARPAQIVLA